MPGYCREQPPWTLFYNWFERSALMRPSPEQWRYIVMRQLLHMSANHMRFWRASERRSDQSLRCKKAAVRVVAILAQPTPPTSSA